MPAAQRLGGYAERRQADLVPLGGLAGAEIYADGAADWDIGDIERYYIPGLGEVAGDAPGGQSAEWRPVARLAM